MATRIVLTDDIDGSDGAETVSFAIDGRSYEIDLATKSRMAFDKALAKYVANARRVGHTARRRSTSTSNSDGKARTKAIREWATAEGYELSTRGRVPNDVVEAYDASH